MNDLIKQLTPAAGCGPLFHGQRGCRCPRPWRIKKSHYDAAFPWLVSRFTGDFCYEPVMRCSSFDNAARLVQALVWISIAENAASSIVMKGNPYVR